MTETTPTDAKTAFEKQDAIERTDGRYEVTTTPFDAWVTASETDLEWALAYTVVVEVPTLSAVVEGDVGAAVEEGWLDTLRRRAEDAPQSTRSNVDLDSFEVQSDGETVTIEYVFTSGTPATAADIAKAFVEYVEGTYVEGVVPGYEYTAPVTDLLSSAQSGGAEGDRGGTPL